jgi:hypothetical protein
MDARRASHDYEEIVYETENESESESESEKENEVTFEPSFKHREHIERERPHERNDNMLFVKRFLLDRQTRGDLREHLLISYANKISKLNTTLLKEVVEKKTKSFTIEQYRYYRFLKHLVGKC